jgi:hypothetical protein
MPLKKNWRTDTFTERADIITKPLALLNDEAEFNKIRLFFAYKPLAGILGFAKKPKPSYAGSLDRLGYNFCEKSGEIYFYKYLIIR